MLQAKKETINMAPIKPQIVLVDDSLKLREREGYDVKFPVSFGVLSENEYYEISDPAIRELIEVMHNNGDFECLATCLPVLMIDMVDRHIIRPSLVILDWDYNEDRENEQRIPLIRKLITETPSFILVYTNQETDAKIALENDSFMMLNTYRWKLVKKEDDEERIKNWIQELLTIYQDNFLFNFSLEAQNRAFRAINRVCASLTRFTSDQIVVAFAEKLQPTTVLDGTCMASLILRGLEEEFSDNKPQDIIASYENKDGKINGIDALDFKSKIRDLWRILLYSYEKRVHVRKGDIVSIEGALYLVVTGDCDLVRFKEKTSGLLRLFHIHVVNDQLDTYKKNLFTKKKCVEKMTSIGSGYAKKFYALPEYILGSGMNWYIDGTTTALLVDEGEGPLGYSEGGRIKFVCHLKPPFSTTIIENAISVYTGHGTMDCNDIAKEALFS